MPFKLCNEPPIVQTNVEKVYLVRHGDRKSGSILDMRKETPLTQLGRHQADETAKTLAKNTSAGIICSPYLRTAQTARKIAKKTGHEVVVSDLFSEFHQKVNIARGRISALEMRANSSRYTMADLGAAVDGQSRDSSKAIKFTTAKELQLANSLGPHGEEPAEFHQRCRASWKAVLAYGDKQKMKILIIVTHADICNYLVSWLSSGEITTNKWHCGTCSITKVKINTGTGHISEVRAGSIDHLDSVNMEVHKNPKAVDHGSLPALSPHGQKKLNEWRKSKKLPPIQFDKQNRCVDAEWRQEAFEETSRAVDSSNSPPRKHRHHHKKKKHDKSKSRSRSKSKKDKDKK